MTTLIIAAHPDDEVLGCGGTIRRIVNEGEDVFIAILGEGITSRYNKREEADQSLIKALHQKSAKAAELMGAKDLFMYSLPDNRFDSVPILDVVKIVEKLVEQLKPDAIFTQHGGDLNIDHVQTYRAVLTATRPMAGRSVKHVYGYEVASSTEWAFQQFTPVFRPNYFVNIEDTLETKIEAMECYESEARQFPHPRAPQSLRSIAQRWGSVVGVKAAEAFQLVWEVI